MKLSYAEREIAENMGLSHEAFAAGKVALAKKRTDEGEDLDAAPDEELDEDGLSANDRAIADELGHDRKQFARAKQQRALAAAAFDPDAAAVGHPRPAERLPAPKKPATPNALRGPRPGTRRVSLARNAPDALLCLDGVWRLVEA